MRVIIAGSRNVSNYALVEKAVKASGFDVTEIISGLARGVDLLGQEYGVHNSIPVRGMAANWRPNGEYNPRAGFERNEEMAKVADAVIAVWDGVSGGTAHMISRAKAHNLKVYVYLLTKEDKEEEVRLKRLLDQPKPLPPIDYSKEEFL